MKEYFTYLTIEQGYALLFKIEELKEISYFEDGIVENFEQEVYKQSAKITINKLNIRSNLLQKLQKNGEKLKVPTSRFEYVARLTEINVFDKDTVKEYTKKLEGIGTKAQSKQQILKRK